MQLLLRVTCEVAVPKKRRAQVDGELVVEQARLVGLDPLRATVKDIEIDHQTASWRILRSVLVNLVERAAARIVKATVHGDLGRSDDAIDDLVLESLVHELLAERVRFREKNVAIVGLACHGVELPGVEPLQVDLEHVGTVFRQLHDALVSFFPLLAEGCFEERRAGTNELLVDEEAALGFTFADRDLDDLAVQAKTKSVSESIGRRHIVHTRCCLLRSEDQPAWEPC